MTREYLKTAVEAARCAGALLKSRLGKIKKISYKGEINLVTDVDKKSESLIVKIVTSRYPDHEILSEESAFTPSGSRYKWIIDPLDATTNYAHGFPFFCVSIALEKEGDIIVGAVYDPMRGELFYAQKRKGAFLNGKRIMVSRVGILKRALLATGFSYTVSKYNASLVHFKNFLIRAQAVRRAGSAALDLCYVACGRFDGFWELDLKPWDMAAGKLIVEEARGRVSSFSGGKYSVYAQEILASNKKVHREMITVLGKGDKV